nr:hypothetical protein [Tanacetum cinerariifolium]
MNNTSWTSVTPHVDKHKLIDVTPYSKKLHASILSHYVPQPRKFNVMKHRNVIAPGMFKIDPTQTSRVDLVPNNQSSASIKTNPITNFQRHVTFKENVSSDTVNASYIRLVHTARTRRPQPKGNSRNAMVPSASKSSEVKKNVTVEDHRKILLLPKNQKTMSSECNNIKLAIQNDKSEIVCGTVRFGNNHIAAILGYGDLKWGNITITRVYFVEGLGHNLFSGKSKRAFHPPKPIPNSKQRLHMLYIDLCGPMRVASINGKWYVLVIVNDYSRYTWVQFLRTKDETPEEYFDSVGITHETSAAKTPQQNRVVERSHRRLVEAARTMLIFSHAPLFLWAKAIATACTDMAKITKKIPKPDKNKHEIVKSI